MAHRKLTLEELQEHLKELGIMARADKHVRLYSWFKKRASLYDHANKKLVVIGQPQKNLFGFYIDKELADSVAMKEAYKMLTKLAKGDMTDYDAKSVQWGNNGVPVVGDMSQKRNLVG